MHYFLVLLLLVVALFSDVSGFFGLHSRRTREPVEIIPKSRRDIQTQWIEQRLDHFDPRDIRTWQMRYLANDEHFKPGGPVVILIGGEWEIHSSSLLGGQVYDISKQHNGYMFYTEHRYYGKSRPTKDTSTENLKYLNVDQALADLAYFVKYVKETIPGLSDSKVVVLGGSYAGSMAAWFRLKYPHLVNGALASSAPLQAIANFFQYYQVVGDSLRIKSGRKCYGVVEEGMIQLRRELNSVGGMKAIQKLFNTCKPVHADSPLDFGTFVSNIAELFAGLVQYHDDGDIERVCDILIGDASNNTELYAIAQYAKSKWGTGRCVAVEYKDMVEAFQEIDWDKPSTSGSMRQWFYQTCTEYGYYQTDSSWRQPFGTGAYTLDMYIQLCKDLYGDMFTENAKQILEIGINRTNVMYGELNPDVTNVIFTHGTVDPWHAIGVWDDVNESSPTIVVPGTSHCKDMQSISSSDSKEMKEAKTRVLDIFAQWLSNTAKTDANKINSI